MLNLLASRTVWMGLAQLALSTGLLTKAGIELSTDDVVQIADLAVGGVTVATGIGTILFRKKAKGPI